MRGLVIVAALAWAGAAHAQEDSAAARSDTLRRVVQLPVVEVSTTRADGNVPLARSIVRREELQRANWGQDTPMALATLPGVYAYSDAGNGIGYSYLSIRGFPQRRISVMVNGVPLNDPESHEVYWIDHPDLLASASEVLVQRGVGSALYGAASVGGSVNLETSPFGYEPGFTAAYGYGSYATRRLMLEGNSGRLEGDWYLYGRYSRIETDGYRERSDSKLWSYALSARKVGDGHVVRLNLYGGPEETHLAYLGVPQPYLDGSITGDPERDRRFNPITYDGERDHFFEPHYELIHSWALSRELGLTQTLFYFDGEGFYDEQRFGRSLADFRLSPWATTDSTLFPRAYYAQDTNGVLIRDPQGRATVERFDLVRKRWVKNRHYGWVPRLRLEAGDHAITVGGEIRAHDGRHVGSVISGNGLPPGTPADHVYYDYHPRTLSTGLFFRDEWKPFPRLSWTADLAWRHQGYAMRDDRFGGVRFDQPYDFAIPRLGVRYDFDAGTLFGSVAHSRREPAFRDLFDAEGAGSVPLFDAAGEPLIRPERVNDYELGFESSTVSAGQSASLGVNLFRMDFHDELVYAGQFDTDLGFPILGNAARSVHQGAELVGSWSASDRGRGLGLQVQGNATLSDNHFIEYREYYAPGAPTGVYDGNAIPGFPATLANLSVRATWRGASLGLDAQQVGRIYLDPTENEDASIEPRTVLNLRASHRFAVPGSRGAEVGVRVLNLFDEQYETGGYMDYDALGNLVPHFVPAATRNLIGEVRIEF